MLMFLNKSQTPAKTPKPTKKIFFVDFPQKFSGKFAEEMFNFYGIPNFFEREFKLLKEKMNYRNYQFHYAKYRAQKCNLRKFSSRELKLAGNVPWDGRR